MRLGQTSIIYFSSKVGGSLLGFLATVYFARTLGEEVLGQYALVLTIVTWLGLAGKVGLSQAITKRISEDTDPGRFLGAGLLITTALTACVAIIVLIFGRYIDIYVGTPVSMFVVAIIFVTLYKSIINSSLKGSHLVHIYAYISILKQFLRSLIQVVLVLFGFGLSGLLWGYITAFIITSSIGYLVMDLRPSKPSKKHILSLFDFAKFSWLGSIRGRTFETMDIAVLGFFITQGLIGVYSITWSISKFLDLFGGAISNTLFPEMSKVASKNNPSAVSGLITDSLTYAGLILVPGLVGSIVLGDRLLLIYGESFVVGTEVLTILIVSLLIYTYTKQLLNTLNAIDRPDLAFRANLVFVVANVVLNVILIWQYGWVGAAIATAISAGLGFISSFWYTKNEISFTFPTREIIYQWIAALGMGTIVYFIRRFVEARWSWINEINTAFVVFLVGIGAITYFILVFVLSKKFRTTVTNNMPSSIYGS